MRLHILGICGTFMSGIALIAKQRGHIVTGSDLNVYPPMSTQLTEQGIALFEGYDPQHIPSDVDCVVVGNVVKRGNPAMEYVMAERIPYISGPEWLAENVLKDQWVLAVSGTHGKTTTTSMLAWILEGAGYQPGFLIGGIPENFGISARVGEQNYFVIEADEYDSAFFDKRSKFIHYHPKTLILNNLEFDHADIFPDLGAIKQQFHYLVRTVPGNGLIIANAEEGHVKDVLEMGCWTPVVTFGLDSDWQAICKQPDGGLFDVQYRGKIQATVSWHLLGQHNVANALAAIAAAHHVGIDVEMACKVLSQFKNVKRRMEVKGEANGITVYDDFAHHPTAIATTLSGLRAKVGAKRIIAVLEFGSYTMRTGVHKDKISSSLKEADMIVCKATETDWGLSEALAECDQTTMVYASVDELVRGLVPMLRPDDHVLIMSNGGFGGIHQKLLNEICQK